MARCKSCGMKECCGADYEISLQIAIEALEKIAEFRAVLIGDLSQIAREALKKIRGE